MFNLDPYIGGYDDDGGTVFRDVIMLTLCGFIVIVLLLLPHVNPISKANDQDIASPGNIIVEMYWPEDLTDDIDLWIQSPVGNPVGYSNKSDKLFNLLRDDLGGSGDLTGLNFETAYSRGVLPGEYIVNTHLYRLNSGTSPIDVRIVVSIKKDEDTSSSQILARTVQLEYEGQELTVFRFELDDDGQFLPSSVHDIPISLRTSGGED